METTMREILESNNIEYQESAKYYTVCPKCSHSRKKSNLKTLSVSMTDTYASVKCMHSTDCELNSGRLFMQRQREPISERIHIKETFVYIPEGMEIPAPAGAIKYKYCDKVGNILYYVVRTEDKKFYPMSLTEDGELVAKKPDFKTLYGAELLHDDDRPVLVVEGEKAAEAAREIFKASDVVTWSGGASNVLSNPWELIRGRNIILWPDNDKPGIDAMERLAKQLDSSRISIIDPTSLDAKVDLADNIPLEKVKELYKNRKILKKDLIPQALSMQDFVSKLVTSKARDPFHFTNIDRELRMPRSGLVIIEGRSGHGKSVFMINSAIRMLRNTDRKVVFVSYEIPEQTAALRMLMAMEEKQFSNITYRNEEEYITAIQKGELKAVEELDSYMKDRLWITDKNYSIGELRNILDADSLENAIIYLDYLQLIPGNSKDSNARYLVIKDIADTLREVANKRSQIIMTGSQLTNGETPYQDVAREGKDITNASEITLKVWNKDVARVTQDVKTVKRKGEDEVQEDYYNEAGGNFAVQVKKSRVGSVGKVFGFNLMYGSLLKEFNEENTAF